MATLRDEIGEFLKTFKPQVTNRNDDYFLEIDRFATIPWHAPLKGRLFQKKPNTELYEETTTGLISFLLQRFDIRTFFDAGAASGYFSRLCLTYQPRAIDVHAFEMQPSLTPKLNAIMAEWAKDGRSGKAYCAGLSDTDRGTSHVWYSVTKLYETKPEESDYRDSIWRRIKFALKGRENRDELKEADIEITSIDAFSKRENVVPDLIKIDVDGHEGPVLKGGRETFATHFPFVVLELHKDRMLAKTGMNRRDAVKVLFDAGYQALFVNDHHDLETTLSDVGEGDTAFDRQKTDQFLFWHPKTLERLGRQS